MEPQKPKLRSAMLLPRCRKSSTARPLPRRAKDRTESARVTLTRKDGTQEERYVPYVPGYPTHPLAKAEVEEKAHELIEPVLGVAAADRLIALCDDLDDAGSVDPIVELMRFESA